MPRIMASSYRLGLCPSPDSSKFSGTGSKPGTQKVKQTVDEKSSSTVGQTVKSGVPTDSQKDGSSVIGYANPQGPDSLLTTSSTIQSAKTNEVMSTSTETDSTTASSYMASLAESDPLQRQFTRRHALTLLGAGIGVGIGAWAIPSLFRRNSTSNLASAVPPAPTDAIASSVIEQASYSVPSRGIVLRGGGSTFIRPALERWATQYQKQTGVEIEYSAVGSSKGFDGLVSNFLDFACTDTFLSDDQIAEAGADILHVPLALGAIVPAFNVPAALGEPLALRFTGATLANIFLGKVKKWNDPAIVVSNPGRNLPDLEIIVVHRTDSSGTTALWTDFLSRSNSTWKSQVGAGNSVQWPAGIGAEKNDGVADTISRTVGAIGYVELTYALANGLQVGQIKNHAGEFVEPSMDALAAAAASLREIPSDFRYSLVDTSGAGTYPIVGTCWALMRTDLKGERAVALVRFLRWATTQGQAQLAGLHYGRIPDRFNDGIATVLSKVAGREVVQIAHGLVPMRLAAFAATHRLHSFHFANGRRSKYK